MAYDIEIAAQAERDLDEIYRWTAQFWSRKQAQQYLSLLKAAILSLRNQPHRCPRAPDQESYDIPVRQLLAGKGRFRHRILFTVKGRTVYILHVRHTARDV